MRIGNIITMEHGCIRSKLSSSCLEYFSFYYLLDSSMDVKREGNPRVPWQFMLFVRTPGGPGGTPSKMPPFLADKITDDQGLKLYQYLVTLRAITVLNPSG